MPGTLAALMFLTAASGPAHAAQHAPAEAWTVPAQATAQATEAPPQTRSTKDVRRWSPTDYTAYSLRPLELRVGLQEQSVGLLPRMQMGTVGALHALGITNGSLKVNALRVGPLDLAVEGRHAQLDLGEFRATRSQVGLRTSLRPTNRWGLHGGVAYVDNAVSGTPDLSQATPLAQRLLPGDEAVSTAVLASNPVDLDLSGQTVRVDVATDVEADGSFIILRATGTVWRHLDRADTYDELAQHDTVDQLLDDKTRGSVPVDHDLTLSAAWQLALGRHAALRLGIGWSSTPGAWVTQTTDLVVRFGGVG